MYKHTQVGWIVCIAIIPVIFALGFWVLLNPMIYPLITVLVILAALILFCTLTVKADDRILTFYFGPGVVRKTFKYSDIKSIQKVRNRWYYGWGVRWFGRGWLYNVSGLDAVELALKDGRVLRIGTDQPDELLRFVSSRLGI